LAVGFAPGEDALSEPAKFHFANHLASCLGCYFWRILCRLAAPGFSGCLPLGRST
jgi:hypothetical protein